MNGQRDQLSIQLHLACPQAAPTRVITLSSHFAEPFHPEDWAAAWASQPEELSYWIASESVDGDVPEGIVGTFFRNGPANFERGNEAYAHILDGDGYVSAWTFHEDGFVHFQSKYVRTR